MTDVHVYGCDVDLFKRVFWGEMPQAADSWHAYHDCVINLIQTTRLSYREDEVYTKDIFRHRGGDHRPRLGPRGPASHPEL